MTYDGVRLPWNLDGALRIRIPQHYTTMDRSPWLRGTTLGTNFPALVPNLLHLGHRPKPSIWELPPQEQVFLFTSLLWGFGVNLTSTVVSGSHKRWYILPSGGLICYLPPIKGTRKLHWLLGYPIDFLLWGPSTLQQTARRLEAIWRMDHDHWRIDM